MDFRVFKQKMDKIQLKINKLAQMERLQ